MSDDPPPHNPTAGLARRDKRVLTLLGVMALLTFFGALGLAGYAALNYKYERTEKNVDLQSDAPVSFTVPKGAGLNKIANLLEREGVIDSAFIFKTVTKLRGNEAHFKAGEFNLIPGMPMSQIYARLANGPAILYPVTLAEGLTSAMIAAKLDLVGSLIDDNPSLPAEGTLLPETYLTPRGMKQSQLLQNMAEAQTALLDKLWAGRDPSIPVKTKAEAIILASVVEKETGVGMERGQVAAVFTNRLRLGMMLQSDPTIIYGVTKGMPLGRRIRQSEINAQTDWNTYQMKGLPKTPICNPGADAIYAVLHPEETEALYFVADGTGGHVFAKTLKEHERNVAKWRRIQKKRGLR